MRARSSVAARARLSPSAASGCSSCAPIPRGQLVASRQSEPGGMAHDIVVRQHPRRRRADRGVGGQRPIDRFLHADRVPADRHEVEVEGLLHLVAAHVAAQSFGGCDPGLGDQDAVARVLREHRVPAAIDVVHIVLVPHRAAVAAALELGRLDVPVGKAGLLDEPVRDIDAEPVDTAVQPEPEDVLELGDRPPGCASSGRAGPGRTGGGTTGEPRGHRRPASRRSRRTRTSSCSARARRVSRDRRGTGSARWPRCPVPQRQPPGTTRARSRCGSARGRRSPAGPGRAHRREERRSRPACRTTGRCRGSRRRRNRRRPAATHRRGRTRARRCPARTR